MDFAEATDIELIMAVRTAGPGSSADELMRRHLPRLRGMMYQMTLSHADADDLTQEVFIRAWRGLPGFRGTAAFSTWLHRIAMNCANRFLARRARHPAIPLEDAPEPPAPCGDRPDLRVSATEADERIRSALAALSPKLRAAMVLTVMQDLSLPEAARIEGCALATLYWRVHEARRQLKHTLAEYLT